MNYEIVNRKESVAVGMKIRTRNSEPDVSAKIGNLWKDFFSGDVYASIQNKLNGKTLGMYTNYESDATGAYDVVAACEVTDAANQPDGLATITIPAGKYAKFVVKGDMQKAVAEFWQALWADDSIDRAYTCDFEEYQSAEMENAEIHMYISIK